MKQIAIGDLSLRLRQIHPELGGVLADALDSIEAGVNTALSQSFTTTVVEGEDADGTIAYAPNIEYPGARERSNWEKHGERVSILDFGAVADGATDNAAAFAAASAFVNGFTRQVAIEFPAGTYLYSSGLSFTKPVWLVSDAGAILNYSGTGKAVKFGPDGLGLGNFTSHFNYGVRGLEFRGGASMTHGVYFNSFLTQPRIIECVFRDFGNPSAYGLYFQSSNWDSVIANCRWYTTSAAVGRNWIRVHGIDSGGVSDFGQSRLRLIDCLASHQDTAGGLGVYVSGVNSLIKGCKIEGFSTNIRVGSRALYTKILHNYFEVTAGSSGNIEIGDVVGHPDVLNWPSYITVADCYCNIHNSDFGTTASFIAPSATTTGFQYATVKRNSVTQCSQVLVKQNNVASQIGNLAEGNSIAAVATPAPINGNLHTTGASISNWNGLDGDEFNYRQHGNRQVILVLQAGATVEQYRSIAFRSGVDGLDKATIQVLPSGRLDFTVNGSSRLQIDTNGDGLLPGGVFIEAATGKVYVQTDLYVNTLTDGQPMRVLTGHKLGTGKIDLENVNDVTISGSAEEIVVVKNGGVVGRNGVLTAFRPLKTGGSGQPVTGKIDGGSSNEFVLTGTAGNLVKIGASNELAELSTVPVANGGTGANTASGARTNLDVYSKSEVYTKSEVDALLAGKANSPHTHGAGSYVAGATAVTGTSGNNS